MAYAVVISDRHAIRDDVNVGPFRTEIEAESYADSVEEIDREPRFAVSVIGLVSRVDRKQFKTDRED